MRLLALLLALTASSTLQIQAQTQIELEDKMFSENWFDDLDACKESPEKVWYLDIALQKLKSFPTLIFELSNLKELYISYNYWPSIPNGLSKLKNLEILDISGHYYMNSLPEDLYQMTWLKQVIVKDHKLNAGEVDKLKKALPDTEILTD